MIKYHQFSLLLYIFLFICFLRILFRVLANYLSWRFVFQHLGFLGKDFRQIVEGHYRIVNPKLGNLLMRADRWISRWRQCVIYVKNLMPLSLLLEYGDHINMRAREKEVSFITFHLNYL